MRYILLCVSSFMINITLALGISDFELSIIRQDYITHESNKNIKSQWCRSGNYLANHSIFCVDGTKKIESRVIQSGNNQSLFDNNSNQSIGTILNTSIGLVSQLPLQDQNLRNALNRFGEGAIISIQPIEQVDMTIGANQLKFKYRY